MHAVSHVVSHVVSVSADHLHRFGEAPLAEVVLLEGLGVQGDAHAGVTVQHRSRVAADPTQPNLRQVHLIHAELLDELREQGFAVEPGQLGENVTTRGIDLLGLSTGTLLQLGDEAVVEVTGLRSPCAQIEGWQDGLLRQLVGQAPDGSVVRKAGVMGVVRRGGTVRPQDPIALTAPEGPPRPLQKV